MDWDTQLERHIDLPRAIVWDALLDPVLVEGWFHPTARLVDGAVRQRLDPVPGSTAVLETEVDPFGILRFELVEREGGTRGTSTLVRVRVSVEEGWDARLDDLENLLRGHPVRWQDPPAEEQRA